MSSHSYFIQKTLTCRSRTRIPFWPTIIPRWRPAPPQGQEGQQRCDEDQGNSQTMESNFSTSRKSPAAGELGGIWICYDWKTDSLGSDLKRDFQVHATSGKVGKAVEGLLSNKGLNEGQVSVIQAGFQTKLSNLSAQAGKTEASGDGGQQQLSPNDPGLWGRVPVMFSWIALFSVCHQWTNTLNKIFLINYYKFGRSWEEP